MNRNGASGQDFARLRALVDGGKSTQPKTGRARDWYRVYNHAASSSAEIFVYDEIGFWGVSASDFVREVAALNVKTISLRINSPGGEVFDGVAMFNALRNHPARVDVTVDGLAASIASVIAMAGDTVTMGRGSQMMIHDALAVCVGNAADMRSAADLLDKCSDNIAGFYADRAGGTVANWRATMAAETWYTAQETVDAGLADKVADLPPAPVDAPTAEWDLSVFRYPGRTSAPAPGARAAARPAPRPDLAEVGTLIRAGVSSAAIGHAIQDGFAAARATGLGR
jgi:ATP-dependent protease ClpP protease subunit